MFQISDIVRQAHIFAIWNDNFHYQISTADISSKTWFKSLSLTDILMFKADIQNEKLIIWVLDMRLTIQYMMLC